MTDPTKPVNVVDLSHAGDLGDTIYAIPALRRLANPAHLTLYPSPGVTRVTMDEKNAASLLPLLNVQEGITADWKPTHSSEGLRLDMGVRRFYQNSLNLCDIHNHFVGHDHWHVDMSWLNVDHANFESPYSIIVARSERYRNKQFPWRKIYRTLQSRACFVGTPKEHANFQEEVGPIPYVETSSFLEVARLLAAADLFIGNQSAPRALAEGMKIPVVVEVGNPPNTHFARSTAFYINFGEDPPELSEQALERYWCQAAANQAAGRSIHSQKHLEELAKACRAARRVKGDALEVGVGGGGSAAVISACLYRTLHGIELDLPGDRKRELELSLRVWPVKLYEIDATHTHVKSKHKYAFSHIDVGLDRLDFVAEWVLMETVPGGVIAVSGIPRKTIEQYAPTLARLPLVSSPNYTELTAFQKPRE